MKPDESFIADLGSASEAVYRAAVWAHKHRNDKELRIPATSCRPSFEVRGDYADSGDFFLNGWRFEVKRRDLEFTGTKDYPFATVFVCERYTLERWLDGSSCPTGVFIVNRDCSHAIYGRLASLMPLAERIEHDKAYGERRTFMEAKVGKFRDAW